MPAGPGEVLLTTLFADVHYYFNDPSAKPLHHRFDRASYVYLYHNPAHQQVKLEVANHAGTPEQDAFSGYLSAAFVKHSHLQPTLVTLSINPAAVLDQSAWHLPSFDERNEQKYHFRLHTVDLYLWTEKDAATFVNHLKKTLSHEKLDIRSPGTRSPSEHRNSMSPVVQQLERTAIGSHFQQRPESTTSAHSLPGPPASAASAGASPRMAQPTPMAYNPAAPAAPEPVAYREKTPPPADDGTGTGLSGAMKFDHASHMQPQYASGPGYYSNSNQTTPQHAYFTGPPLHSSSASETSLPGPPGSVPPPPHQQRAPSFGPMAQSTLPQSPPPHQAAFQRASTFSGPPGQTQYANYNPQQQYANYPGSPGFNPQLPPTPSAPPAYAGHTPMQSPGLPPPPPQQLQQPPLGGYSNYNYSSAQVQPSTNPHGAYTGDIHSQVYRPTDTEAKSHSKPKRTNTTAEDGKPKKLTDSLGNVEGKVNKYLGKLDKLW